MPEGEDVGTPKRTHKIIIDTTGRYLPVVQSGPQIGRGRFVHRRVGTRAFTTDIVPHAFWYTCTGTRGVFKNAKNAISGYVGMTGIYLFITLKYLLFTQYQYLVVHF